MHHDVGKQFFDKFHNWIQVKSVVFMGLNWIFAKIYFLYRLSEISAQNGRPAVVFMSNSSAVVKNQMKMSVGLLWGNKLYHSKSLNYIIVKEIEECHIYVYKVRLFVKINNRKKDKQKPTQFQIVATFTIRRHCVTPWSW